jgi:hypothetical protein
MSSPDARLQNAFTEISALAQAKGIKVTDFFSESTYAKAATFMLGLSNVGKATATTFRVLITLPDGTVAFDSGKGNKNTYANFDDKLINENHNSRVAIMTALLSTDGNGVEKKLSSSSGTNEVYHAFRIGLSSTEAVGVMRLSLKQ